MDLNRKLLEDIRSNCNYMSQIEKIKNGHLILVKILNLGIHI